MSTLEKAVKLMKNMPEHKIETIYAFIRFIDSDPNETIAGRPAITDEDVQSLIGIAHEIDTL